MHTPDIPKLKFCEWVPWRERSRLLRNDGPWLGVYLWGHFRRPPAQSVKPYPPLLRQVIYIGEAKNIDRRPRFRAAVHAARNGALRRWCRTRPERRRDGNHRLGREGESARSAHCQQGGQWTSGAHAPALSLSTSGPLQGAGKHRRGSEFQLCGAVGWRASHRCSAAFDPSSLVVGPYSCNITNH
jgi:hypothetical protein